MKKLLLWAMVLGSILLGSCTKDDESGDYGSIYGIVTELGTAEPMKAVGVELYKGENYYYHSDYNELLLKTVTFDDGHFEFTDLESGSYFVRVVADGYMQTERGVTVEAGRQARIDLQVSKINTKVVVSTQDATVNGNDVILNAEFTYGNYYSETYPTEVGFVYSNQKNPSNGGTIVKCKKEDIKNTSSNYTKTFSTKFSGLSKGTYYYQAYAINSIGKTYGEVRSFSLGGYPSVSTLDATNVKETSATLNGRIDYEGDPAYTERGFVYSKSFPRPTVEDPSNATTKIIVSGRSEDFSANVSSLTENAQYYVRAYATNANGTVYGEVKSFTYSDQNYVVIDNLMIQTTDLGKADWDTAKDMCKNSRIGGYSDWRLPTLSELAYMYTHREEIGGFTTENYWSSTYPSNGGAYSYCISFNDGTQYTKGDSSQFRVRAVRTK